ncbi:MAG: TerC family protein [Helicobacter sp.]|nr:TerC family protein [Helicobacter sp.]
MLEIFTAIFVLILLEIILGIDNIIFISICVLKLPSHQQKFARLLGLGLAMFARVALLFSMSWLITLEDNLFYIYDLGFSGKELFLIAGGLFLIYKGISEIIEFSYIPKPAQSNGARSKLMLVLSQIVVLDIVFSLDSVITAIGFLQGLNFTNTQIIAIGSGVIILTVLVMMVAITPIGNFISRHQSIKILALMFLVLVGADLVLGGFELHIPRGYIYSAMGFGAIFEIINIIKRRKIQ